MDGGWIKVYLYNPQQSVIFMNYVILGNVGSIVLSKVILFAKCHIISDIIISAHVTDELIINRRNEILTPVPKDNPNKCSFKFPL